MKTLSKNSKKKEEENNLSNDSNIIQEMQKKNKRPSEAFNVYARIYQYFRINFKRK